MGTRCLTVFKDEKDKEIVVMYRQCDGYPDGHGQELSDYLKGKKLVNGIPCGEDSSKMFNGPGCLAASVVSHFKDRVGGFYLHPPETRDRCEDYTYFVSGKTGEEPTVKIHQGKEEIFNGHPSNFDDWLEGYQNQDQD